MNDAMTAQEVADFLGCCEKHVRNLLNRKLIRGIRTHGRWQVSRTEAVRFAVSIGTPPEIIRGRLSRGDSVVCCGLPRTEISAAGHRLVHVNNLFDAGMAAAEPGVYAVLVSVSAVDHLHPVASLANFAKRVDRPHLIGFSMSEVQSGIFDDVYPEADMHSLGAVIHRIKRSGT